MNLEQFNTYDVLLLRAALRAGLSLAIIESEDAHLYVMALGVTDSDVSLAGSSTRARIVSICSIDGISDVSRGTIGESGTPKK
jgi:hypothetical protein